MADYDKLTQLLNRQAAEKEILELMSQKVPFVLILIDLNGFKQVNDIHGHEAGDEILVHVSGLLKKGIRRNDLACRWGGDEFVIILTNITKEITKKVVGKLVGKIKKPYYLSCADEHVTVGASMGAAFFPEDESSMKGLVHLADQTMYVVKRKRSEEYIMFSNELD